FPQQIDEELALLGMLFLEPGRKPDLARLSIKIVQKQHPIVAPVISHDEDRRVAARDYREVAPSHLGDFLAHADDPFGPIQQRVRMPTLDRSVDVLETVRTARDDWDVRLVALGEAAVWLVRPLHRRAGAVALRKLQIFAHAELVAVAENRRTGQR